MKHESELMGNFLRLLKRSEEAARRAKDLPDEALIAYAIRTGDLSSCFASVKDSILFMRSSEDDSIDSGEFWKGVCLSLDAYVRQLESTLKECEAIK